MSKSIQLKNRNNEKMYPHPYYPVGSIYLSVVNTNPSTWFGGTWELIAKGRTLVGVDTNDADFNTVQKTGGSKSKELRALIGATHSTTSRIGYAAAPRVNGFNYTYSINGNDVIVNTDNINHTTFVKDTNGNDLSLLQPYFTCYIWCRTA